MLRQNFSYKNNIDTRKKSNSEEKIQLKVAILQKQVKGYLLKMLIYHDFTKKCQVTFKKFLLLL